MSNSVLCDNCKREPSEFKTEGGETAYWLRVPKENQDPSVMMSSMDFAFVAMVPEKSDDKRHPTNDEENFYWCADCCASAYPEQDVL